MSCRLQSSFEGSLENDKACAKFPLWAKRDQKSITAVTCLLQNCANYVCICVSKSSVHVCTDTIFMHELFWS